MPDISYVFLLISAFCVLQGRVKAFQGGSRDFVYRITQDLKACQGRSLLSPLSPTIDMPVCSRSVRHKVCEDNSWITLRSCRLPYQKIWLPLSPHPQAAWQVTLSRVRQSRNNGVISRNVSDSFRNILWFVEGESRGPKAG